MEKNIRKTEITAASASAAAAAASVISAADAVPHNVREKFFAGCRICGIFASAGDPDFSFAAAAEEAGIGGFLRSAAAFSVGMLCNNGRAQNWLRAFADASEICSGTETGVFTDRWPVFGTETLAAVCMSPEFGEEETGVSTAEFAAAAEAYLMPGGEVSTVMKYFLSACGNMYGDIPEFAPAERFSSASCLAQEKDLQADSAFLFSAFCSQKNPPFIFTAADSSGERIIVPLAAGLSAVSAGKNSAGTAAQNWYTKFCCGTPVAAVAMA